MAIFYPRVAKDTVQYMTQSVGEGTELGLALAAARQNTKHFKHEDTLTLEPRPAEALHETIREVTQEDTLFAAKRLISEGFEEPCVLNFADAFQPGGLFLQGVTTQEERLARCTGLYWCIKDQSYYQRNLQAPEGQTGLYLHDALYSPHVPVFRDLVTEDRLHPSAVYPISILTCPAPNAWYDVGDLESEFAETMGERIRRILTIMANTKHKAIVLGAYGCGAFVNDPNMVATHFKTCLDNELNGYFRKTVFAIRESADDTNITVFRSIL